jgi:hypothetical protein
MKKLLMICFFIGCVLNNSLQQQEQQGKIHVSIISAFASKFPKAQKVKWSVETPGELEAEFELNGIASAAVLDTNGKLIKSETEISASVLPQPVLAEMYQSFAGFKISKIKQVIDSNNFITYGMVAGKGESEYDLVFLVNGKLFKKEEINKDSKASFTRGYNRLSEVLP